MLTQICQDPLLKDSHIPFHLILNKITHENALSSKEIVSYIEFNDIKLKNKNLKWGVEEADFAKGEKVFEIF